jgi:hypothetical protein
VTGQTAMNPNDKDDNELVRLLEEMEKMARDLMGQFGGYPPFGGTIDDQGQVGLVFDQTAVTGGATPQTAERVLVSIRQQAQAPNIRAAAVAGMAYVKDPETDRQTSAMVITLHHRSGRNVDYVTPFSKAASGAIRFGQSFAGLSKVKLL